VPALPDFLPLASELAPRTAVFFCRVNKGQSVNRQQMVHAVLGGHDSLLFLDKNGLPLTAQTGKRPSSHVREL
jgi:hypothetical protein